MTFDELVAYVNKYGFWDNAKKEDVFNAVKNISPKYITDMGEGYYRYLYYIGEEQQIPWIKRTHHNSFYREIPCLIVFIEGFNSDKEVVNVGRVRRYFEETCDEETTKNKRLATLNEIKKRDIIGLYEYIPRKK